MSLYQLAVTIRSDLYEVVTDWLEDQALSVAIDLDGDRAQVIATFDHLPDRGAVDAHIAILQQLDPAAAYTLTEIPTADWLAMVGREAGAGRIGRFMLLDAPAPSAQLLTHRDIYVEAFGAFGDGTHPTTRGCLLALQYLAQRRRFQNIADIGCGSGVLSFIARKLWPQARLIASDLDPRAVRTTRRNRAYNAAAKMTVTGGPGFAARQIAEAAPFDLVLMNILARPLSRLAKAADSHVKPGGCLVLSGLLSHQVGMIASAYRAQRLALVRQSVQDGWVTLILHKRPA